MACLLHSQVHHHQIINITTTTTTMYNQNSDHQMSPRISFSNDFAESAQYSRQQLMKPRDSLLGPPPPPLPPSASDFEFSVSNYSMMPADELFSKGRLLPFKNNVAQKTTLREELLAGEDDDDRGISCRPPKGSSSSSGSNRWKGFLGRKKSNIGSKRSDKTDEKTGTVTKTSSQEMMNEGGGSSSNSCRDVEFRMH